MAVKAIVKVISFWKDKGGKFAKSKVNIDKHQTDSTVSITTIQTDVAAILTDIEKITQTRYDHSVCIIPLPIETSGYKDDPVAGGSFRQKGYIEFVSEVGDAGKATKTKIWLPDPANANLTANSTNIDMAAENVGNLIDAVKAHCITSDGRALVGTGQAGYRKTATRK